MLGFRVVPLAAELKFVIVSVVVAVIYNALSSS